MFVAVNHVCHTKNLTLLLLPANSISPLRYPTVPIRPPLHAARNNVRLRKAIHHAVIYHIFCAPRSLYSSYAK
jgi:hypothetical protein